MASALEYDGYLVLIWLQLHLWLCCHGNKVDFVQDLYDHSETLK